MPEADKIVAVVGEWITKAENDLQAAAHILTLGKKAPTDTICFHAQQCVEKYLKAILVYQAISFPKTDLLHVLMELLPADSRPELDRDIQDQFTKYATTWRYPGAGIDIPLVEARKAVATARRVRREARRVLPTAALRRKKMQ